eukprot:11906353-Alexandrium_andersonii.AAC.1
MASCTSPSRVTSRSATWATSALIRAAGTLLMLLVVLAVFGRQKWVFSDWAESVYLFVVRCAFAPL